MSVRLAWNWRSKFLLTARDVIVPFAPIINEATGQLDGSIFYTINDHIRIGIQAVNLTNEVTKTSQVINNDLVEAPRSWFMNDRRFTGIVRVAFAPPPAPAPYVAPPPPPPPPPPATQTCPDGSVILATDVCPAPPPPPPPPPPAPERG